MKQKYTGFTLVEMLIVMGILSVLMGIGVAVARFAMQRANNIAHQNSVDQLYQAFQSYYTDNRKYPAVETGGFTTFEDALLEGGNGVLDSYVDASFDGGSPAVYYYIVNLTNAQQSFLVCVSFSDEPTTDAAKLGGYCNGNGFGELPTVANPANSKTIKWETAAVGFHSLINAQCVANPGFCAQQTWDSGWQ